MNTGLARTFEVLRATENRSAARVLIAALDSPDLDVRLGAIEALLLRRDGAGGREVLRRFDAMAPCERAIIDRHPGRLGRALRDAVLGEDEDLFRKACRAAVELRQYDLVPPLLGVLDTPDSPRHDAAAAAVLAICRHLGESLVGPRDPTDRRDFQRIRAHLVEALERSLKRFGRHRRREAVEAILLLSRRSDPALRRILDNPRDHAFPAVLDVLSKSEHRAVLRLLAGFLDDPKAPSAALTVLANRGDMKFVAHCLRRAGRELSAAAGQNLKRLRAIAWLRGGDLPLEQLDQAAQCGAVRLGMASGAPRQAVLALIERVLLHGKTAARREAARALAEFHGAEANALALRALEDPDPEVQAAVAVQLRGRGIPGVVARLVELVDSPHAVVRRAARKGLAEFTIDRYITAFNMLDDEARRTTGILVRKVDPETFPRLRRDLSSKIRGRRMRALQIVRALGAAEPLEDAIVAMLKDEDHLLRAEAAWLLADSATPWARRALEEAAEDRSETVREAARQSLREHEEFLRLREAVFDPRD
jgi:hypothetical protein